MSESMEKKSDPKKKALPVKSEVNKPFFDIARPLCNGVFAVLCPTKVTGRENVPREGAFILCANHISAWDPFMLAIKTPRRYVRFIAKAELFENPFLAWILRALGAYPIHRGQRDMAAMRESLSLLSQGHAVGIFPQGHRAPNASRLKMETGAALFALRAKVPVIPAYIDRRFRLFHRNRISFGSPVPLTDLWGKFDQESMQAATNRIEDAVWGLENM